MNNVAKNLNVFVCLCAVLTKKHNYLYSYLFKLALCDTQEETLEAGLLWVQKQKDIFHGADVLLKLSMEGVALKPWKPGIQPLLNFSIPGWSKPQDMRNDLLAIIQQTTAGHVLANEGRMKSHI